MGMIMENKLTDCYSLGRSLVSFSTESLDYG